MIIKLELIGLFRDSDTHSKLVADIKKAVGAGGLIKFNGLDFAVREYSEKLTLEPDFRYHDGGIVGNRNGESMLMKSRRYHVNAVIELDGKND